MRGKKARRLRRQALPPDLRESAKEHIRGLAAARAEKTHKARVAYEAAELKARLERNRAVFEAVEEFEKRRATVLDATEAKAAEREVAAELQPA